MILAHAANNMINDFFDLEGGVDTDDYARAQYAPHPVLGGLISKSGLRRAILTVNLIDGVDHDRSCCCGPVGRCSPSPVWGCSSVSSTWRRPIRLKHHGLGEPGVFLVWGPLMIGGTYYVTAGDLAAVRVYGWPAYPTPWW